MAALSMTDKDYAEEDYTCARARMANNCRVQRQDIVEISIENVRVPYLFLLARAIVKDMRRSHCGIFRGWLATDALQPSYVRENDVNLERLRYLLPSRVQWVELVDCATCDRRQVLPLEDLLEGVFTAAVQVRARPRHASWLDGDMVWD